MSFGRGFGMGFRPQFPLQRSDNTVDAFGLAAQLARASYGVSPNTYESAVLGLQQQQQQQHRQEGQSVQRLLNQIQQLEGRVNTLSSKLSKPAAAHKQVDPDKAAEDDETMEENEGERKILMVLNLPSHLQSCDAIYFMFKQFGEVDRVKIMRNQMSSAFVQMSTSAEAREALAGHDCLKKIVSNLIVNLTKASTKIKLPYDGGLVDLGLTKDYTVSGLQHFSQSNIMSHIPMMMPGFGGGDGYSSLENRGREMDSERNGPCILVSNLPDELSNLDCIANLIGCFGDVMVVKILHNKRDSALVQLAKPHQAVVCKTYLDGVKVYGKRLQIRPSKLDCIKLPSNNYDDQVLAKRYTDIRGIHRFRNPVKAQQLMKIICTPTSFIHVANIPEELSRDQLKEYFIDNGFAVKEVLSCKDDPKMAYLQLGSPEEAIAAVAKLHKSTPEGWPTPENYPGLWISFSNKRGY